MHIQALGCIISTAILLIAEVCAIIRSECPIACECDLEEKKVECTYGYWNELPNLPTGSKYIEVRNGDFGMLRSPVGCHSYADVTTLKLVDNAITSIAGDSFKCMPRLKSLTINTVSMQKIPHELFLYLPNLQNISVSVMWITGDVIPKLCIMQRLEKITLFTYGRHTLNYTSLECLGLLKHLSYVDLSFNAIHDSIKHVLKPLRNVTNYVSLRSCGITSLENDSFMGFKLQILDLSFNRIQYIPRHAFRNLPFLKTLYINGAGLSETNIWLKGLPIQEFDVSGNELAVIPRLGIEMRVVNLDLNQFNKLESGSISNLSNLVQLSLNFCNISYIERYAFLNLSKLETIELIQNHITGNSLTILLLDLVSSPLRVLDLSANPLVTLNKTFEAFTPNKLEKLMLNNCQIEEIIPGAFENLEKLQLLSLRKTGLKQILPHTFKGLTKLVELYLDNCKLESLHSHAFYGLTALEILNVSSNLLKEFDGEGLGLHTTSLTKLFLSSNKIDQISFRNISTLEEIIFHNNQVDLHVYNDTFFPSLKVMDLSSSLVVGLSEVLPRLVNLTFFKAHILSFEIDGCVGLKRYLEVLSLSETKIGRLKPEQQKQIWQKSYQLETLEISDCKITALVPRMFSSLSHLTILKAASNKIPFIEPTAFENVSRLLELHLDNNLIMHVDGETFIHTPHLRLLSLAANPLQ